MLESFRHFRGIGSTAQHNDEQHAQARSGIEPDDVSLEHVPRGGDVKFRWNTRECQGIALHEAALNEDHEATKRILDEDPNLVFARFTYNTSWHGQAQEGSGEALHLAVTRSSVKVVKLLLDNKADVDAMVTRARKPHYNVLHAAVFCEGKCGNPDVIKYLLEAKASHQKNLEGHRPLHKAFEIGASVDLISILKKDMEELGILDQCENDVDGPVPTPLQVGVRKARLTGEQLANSASITPTSLKIFLHEQPRSIATFITRMHADHDQISPEMFCELVTVEDLCNCLRECPEIAQLLFENLIGAPDVENPGWNPLPTRCSFAPRNLAEKFRFVFNPTRYMFEMYERTKLWGYNSVTFEHPKWHKMITGNHGPPVKDVHIKVCYLPEIVCAEMLSALYDSDYDQIFSLPLVRGMLNIAWWHGAFKVDVVQLAITMLGLVLLIVDRAGVDFSSILSDVFAPQSNATGVKGSFTFWSVTGRRLDIQARADFADDFIGARGVVDLIHEFAQFWGYVRMGKARDYFSFGNVWDHFRIVLALAFYWNKERPVIQVLLILIYWGRLLEISFSENLMREFLPITSLVKGLAPSSVVCCIAVCAFTHAKWAMYDKPLWPDTFHDSFALLITAGLPVPEESDTYNLIFSYLAVSCFSVFFLNIFISVISENYTNEKNFVGVSYLKKRCSLCFFFLVRASVLPGRLMSARTLPVVMLLSSGVLLGTMILNAFAADMGPSQLIIFIICQSLLLLCCYQDYNDIWSRGPSNDGREPRYLWMCLPLENKVLSEQDRVGVELDKARTELEELRTLLRRKGLVPEAISVEAN